MQADFPPKSVTLTLTEPVTTADGIVSKVTHRPEQASGTAAAAEARARWSWLR